ncbi:PTS sugar transporter subunit IIA [Lysinibacillus piscis]|uniref:PTS galactitol transporter subunit IIA n=1 Tax=Lysinibacillus piscis TaxID=2518931 RepID=A0ABQ5NGA4_9BACI|nr:PTS sugar transporter subunit IIA [Lysinibacillus sp. KH24]GLC87153.1 PTS galactitol transporter subunit IIA [Lysinibacillus sp. KH24]
MTNETLLTTKLVELQADHPTKEAVITCLAEKLYEQQYVKESYSAAVLAREVIYPTGLPLANTGVAIPHTDSVHVLKPAIAVSMLKNPVSFCVMGSPDSQVEVSMVLMLAISDPESQLELLQRLMGIFQDAETMQLMQEMTTADELVQLLTERIQ